MTEINVQENVFRPQAAFANRFDAGEKLASYVNPDPEEDAVALAIPRGGIPVAKPIADRLQSMLLPVLARKLPVPASPEMGFGAVSIDGNIVINERLVTDIGLSRQQIQAIAEKVMREVRRRAAVYGGEKSRPDVKGRNVYMVDDGLATGYSMMACAKMIGEMAPAKLTLAVPVSPLTSINTVQSYFNEIYCLYAQESPSFAVASFYQDFHEMSDDEVNSLLAKTNTANG